MKFMYILIILSFFYGIYNILLSIFRIPRLNSEMLPIFKLFKKKSKINKYGDNYSELTHRIAKYIKLPEIFKKRLNERLIMANINSTPELYISNLINKSLTYLLFALLCIPISNFISLIFIYFSLHSIYKGNINLNKEIKERTEKIEREIPKFLDFMINSFKFNKNVKQAFESYEKIAGDNFKDNISITIADMTTGNYEDALKRLDTRINSYSFSKVIRAILQVVKGEENILYLSNLYRESASEEYERLKREADTKLNHVAAYSKILLLCLMIITFTILGIMFYKNFTKVNGAL